MSIGFPGSSDSKESTYQCRRPRFDPWVGKIPWRREWLLTPVFLPGESHGQGSLVGYSLWDHKASDTTEWLSHTHTHTHTHTQFQKLKLYQEVLLPHSSHSYTPSINNYFDLSLFLSCKTNKKKLQMHECFLSLTKSSKLSILFWNFFHLIVYSECHSVFVEIFLIFKPFIVLCHGSQWIRTFSCLGI